MTFWGKNVAEYVAETVARKGFSSSPTSTYKRLFALVVHLVVGQDVVHPTDPEAKTVETEVHIILEVFELDGHDVSIVRVGIVSLESKRLIHLCTGRNIDVKFFTVLFLELTAELFDEFYILRNRIEFETFDGGSRIKSFDGLTVGEFDNYNIFFFQINLF